MVSVGCNLKSGRPAGPTSMARLPPQKHGFKKITGLADILAEVPGVERAR